MERVGKYTVRFNVQEIDEISDALSDWIQEQGEEYEGSLYYCRELRDMLEVMWYENKREGEKVI